MTSITLPSTMATRPGPRHPEVQAGDRWWAERRHILEQLRARGPRTVPELVGAWALAPALVGLWFARLERDGLVWRTPGEAMRTSSASHHHPSERNHGGRRSCRGQAGQVVSTNVS